MENKIAIIGIALENYEAAAAVNDLLHSFAGKIIARFGVPYRSASVNIITIVIDATVDEVNALTGKLGKIKGVAAKTMTMKLPGESE